MAHDMKTQNTRPALLTPWQLWLGYRRLCTALDRKSWSAN